MKLTWSLQAFAEALLIIPKTLARNAGLDQQKVIEELMDNYSDPSNPVGVDLKTGLFRLIWVRICTCDFVKNLKFL